ncbi:MAG: EAL domain-containing protein [Desulfobacterales bacterium]|nr:EAL domain-containing protein [Desulfobacterales bacterium]
MPETGARKSLKARLVRYFSTFVIVLVVSLTLMAAVITSRIMVSDLEVHHLKVDVSHDLDSLEQHLSFMNESLNQFRANHFVINSLVDTLGRILYLPRLISDFKGGRHVAAVTVVDFEGNPIQSSLEEPPPYKKLIPLRSTLVLGKTVMQLSEDRKNIVMAAPIEYYKTPQGAVIVEWELAGIFSQTLQPNPLYSRRLFHGDTPLFVQNFDEHVSYVTTRKMVGEKYPLLSRLGIGIEIGTPKSVLLAPVRSLMVQLLLLGGGFMVIAVLLANRLGNGIARPILRLCERIRRAGLEGEPQCSPVGTGDELEDLALAFDDRAGRLTAARRHLEATADQLRHTNTQLLLLASVFENALEGIVIITVAETIARVNPTFCRITGYGADEVVGRPFSGLYVTRDEQQSFQQMWNALRQDGFWDGELRYQRKNNEDFPTWTSAAAVRDADGGLSHYVIVFHDITEIKRSEEQLQYQAYYDALTGLPNRRLFYDRLEQAMAFASRNRQMLAVLFLDLDNFKNINDSLGHYLGDLFLQAVAQRLRECCRDADSVSRLGGDEFVIILTKVNDELAPIGLARRILASFAEPFALEGHLLFGTASIGITLFPVDGDDVETLVKNADLAMYRAKMEGRNNYQLFTAAMNLKAKQRLTMENNLRRAVEQQEFQVYYQPKISLETGAMVGAEALVRWRLPDGTVVSPAEFIPVAEESGLIIPIGEYVLKTACEQARSWQEAGFSLSVAVNLSPRQFRREDLVDTVAAVLEETGLPPERLELEITEGVVMENREAVTGFMIKLKQMGIMLAIDDFGTGYSSLSYLRHLPINTLKIDISFIREIPRNRDDMAITAAIILMARSLNLRVVAEGVETEEQLAFLMKHGCDYLQGYLFCPPVPRTRFEELLREAGA